MYEDLKKTIYTTNKNAQYDNAVKHLLSQKILLAHILVHTVDEFKGMNPEDVVNLIEGEPEIGGVFVEPGLTNSKDAVKEIKTYLNNATNNNLSDEEVINTISQKLNQVKLKENTSEKIHGYNTEDSEINEGYIRYDIIFYVLTKDGRSKIIINVEAQKDEPQRYNLLERAEFYACRLISSQKTVEFNNSNYNDLKKIYTIWICMNMDKPTLNHVHLTDDKILGNYDWKGNLDLLNIILIGLPKEVVEPAKNYELHRLLGTLLSMDMKADDKIEIVKDEFAIKFNEEMRKGVSSMCNLSEGIYERGMEIGEERGLQKGAKELIALGLEFGLTKDTIITRLQQRFSLSFEKANEYFEMFKDENDIKNS